MSETLLRILRILTWPYRFPPLSWIASAMSWLAATNFRFVTTMVLAAAVSVTAVIVYAR